MKNPGDWTIGCEPKFDFPCNQFDQFGFLKPCHVEFYGYDYDLYPNYTIKMCEDLCLSMCGCKGFQFKYFKVHCSYGIYCYPIAVLNALGNFSSTNGVNFLSTNFGSKT